MASSDSAERQRPDVAAEQSTATVAELPGDMLCYSNCGCALLLMEDIVSPIILIAMVAYDIVDLLSLLPVLLGLHVLRGVCLLGMVPLEKPSSTWPVLLGLSSIKPLSCLSIEFAQPYEFITYVLFGQALVSGILTLAAMAANSVPKKVGAEECGILKALEKITEVAQAQDVDLEHQSMCVICLEEFHQHELLVKLPCGHLHHDRCIRTWLAHNSVCPMRCHLQKQSVVVMVVRQPDNDIAI